MLAISPSLLSQRGMLGMNRRNISYIGKYNDRKLYPLVDNKLKTKLLAEKHNIATPKLRHVLREQHHVKQLLRQLNQSESFVLKPAKGSGGKGILVVTGRSGDDFVKASGQLIDRRDLRRHLSNTLVGLYSLSGASDVAIVEDLIAFDDHFVGYSHEGVPDIRIIVFQGYPVMAMLRLATHASDGKANLHQGAVGVGLAIEDGHCLHAVQFSEHITHHPDTGKALKDIAIPHWQDMLLLAARCYEMTGLGYLGVDLVLDKHSGAQLLELNARPGLAIQIASNQGLIPRLELIESIKRGPASAIEKVHYAMEAFAIRD